MNKLMIAATLFGVMAALACPAHAEEPKAAGLPCTNAPNTLKFGIGSDAMDDLLACVSGTWHSMIYSSLPSGGITAFNNTSCPAGWVDIPALAGRTIIGTGAGVGLTQRNLGNSGGEEQHTQTIAEMPSHNHALSNIPVATGSMAYWTNQFIVGQFPLTTINNATTDSTGGGQPFNVMMPWYALHYCMKQ